MSSLPERLRQGASALRAVDSVPRGQAINGELLAQVPSGQRHVLRVIWFPATDGRPPRLGIRVWRDLGDDRFVPCRDLGLEIPYYRLDAVGTAIARALELAAESVSNRTGGRR